MATIKNADLRAEGEGEHAVLTLELQIDWDRGDDDHRWEAVVRFIGADTGFRGGDEVRSVHSLSVGPAEGSRAKLTVVNADRVFNEDAGGGDEIVAECALQIVQDDVKFVRSNKVTGRF